MVANILDRGSNFRQAVLSFFLSNRPERWLVADQFLVFV